MSDKNANESLLKNWAESQQKLLTNWLDTLRKFGGTPTMELWKATVDAWQNSVKETLDAQTKWTHQWIEVLTNAKGTPEELQTLVRQGREQLQQWTEAEQDLWQSWFKIVREINFKPEAGARQQAGNDLLQLWQDSAYKMIDAQTSFVRRWTTGVAGTKKQG
jgi:hypothetical protein